MRILVAWIVAVVLLVCVAVTMADPGSRCGSIRGPLAPPPPPPKRVMAPLFPFGGQVLRERHEWADPRHPFHWIWLSWRQWGTTPRFSDGNTPSPPEVPGEPPGEPGEPCTNC